MDSLISKLLVQVPDVAAVIIVVFLFIKFIERTNTTFVEKIREMHKEHIDAREQSRETIRENTLVQKENTKAIEALTRVVSRQAP